MKVSNAIKHLSELDPNDEIVINWFSRLTYEDYYNDEEAISDDKWLSLVKHLEDADQFWMSNHYAIEAEVGNWKDRNEDNEDDNEEEAE